MKGNKNKKDILVKILNTSILMFLKHNLLNNGKKIHEFMLLFIDAVVVECIKYYVKDNQL